MHPVKPYKYYYVYQTTNNINGKIYIGVHAANKLENKYLGSGTNLHKAIKKYGRENFTKIILAIYQSYDDALLEEKRIVTPEFINDPNTYNLEIGGLGGKVWTDEMRKKMSNIKKQSYQNGLNPWNKGKVVGNFMTEDTRQKLRNRMKGSGNHMYGKNVADMMTEEANAERLKKISRANQKPKKKTEKYSEYAKKRFWIINSSGILKHCLDASDPRILSGEFQIGRVWRGN